MTLAAPADAGPAEPVAWPPAPVPGWRLVCLDDCTSTNDEARQLALDGAAERTVVVARSQSGGRGRLGRVWAAPPGNLYASTLLRPALPLSTAAQLSFVTALALADAVAAVGSAAAVQLKWPNDLLLGGRKLAGILLESEADRDGGSSFVVLGTGVNLVSHPDGTETPATDLSQHMVPAPSPGAMLHAYLTALDRWYRRWLADGFAPIRDAWLRQAIGLGQEVRVRTPHETFRGRLETLDGEGALVVGLPSGDRRTVTAGEVMLGGGHAAGD